MQEFCLWMVKVSNNIKVVLSCYFEIILPIYIFHTVSIFTVSDLFNTVLDKTNIVKSIIECADLASILNQDTTEPFMPDAINAFKYDKLDQTCILGRIDYIHFGNISTWPALIEENKGIYLLQGCSVRGK